MSEDQNIGSVRKSQRIGGEKLPDNFDEIYPEIRCRKARKNGREEEDKQPATRSVISNLFSISGESLHSGAKFASCRSLNSRKSKSSIASSTKRRILEAELKAEEEKARLADEKAQRQDEKAEREKLLIEKRLAIEKEIIAEENDGDGDSQALSEDEGALVDQMESEVIPPGNLHDTGTKDEKVADWIENQPCMSEDTPVDQLTQALSKVFEKLSTNNSLTENCMKKFLSRQSISKDLPTFIGNPIDWPNFIARFRNSTEAGQYSNSENMDRLMKCLKGKALEAVQSMMFTPDNLTQVLETLEVNFGRPKLIINTLQTKVMNMLRIDESKPEMLIDFSNAVGNLVTTIESLKCTRHLINPMLIDKLIEKLPPNLKLRWGEHIQALEEEESLKDLSLWLKPLAKAASYVRSQQVSEEKRPEQVKGNANFRKEKVHVTSQDTSDKCACVLCGRKNHLLPLCYEFKNENLHNKWKIVFDKKVCFGCLMEGHTLDECEDKITCGIDGCDKFHHKYLHKKIKKNQARQVTKGNSEMGKERCSHVLHVENSVLLKVVPVTLKSNGKQFSTFAFLDDGSTATLMEASVAKKLGLSGKENCLHLKGITNMTTTVEKSLRVNLEVMGKNCEETYELKNVKTVEKLDLPIQTINGRKLSEKWTYLQDIPTVYLKNAVPTILIGQDHSHLINPVELIEGPANGPCATRTRLGWTVHGKTSYFNGRVDDFIHHLRIKNEEDELHQLVKESFSTEAFGVKVCSQPLRSREDERCIQIMDKYTKRVADRWETGLLWRKEDVSLPESKCVAFRRLQYMERKMDKDPNFALEYHKKIAEYVQKGYARKLSPEEAATESGKTWYLPHFGVYNPNKPGKLRFVFDAAAKSHGSSLNDNLMQGPDNLCSLITVLFKFRQKKIGFTADIKEMFHQVNIRSEDQQAQRFLWRGADRNRNPDVYVVPVMTFGATCSPSLAQEVKNRNATEFIDEYPDAVKAITSRHYVDDYLDSAHDEDRAIKIIRDVIYVHKMGGFEIRNWTCSSKEVLQLIPQELRCIDDKDLNLESDLPMERVLGLQWNPNSDNFIFLCKFSKVKDDIISGKKRPTKREILRLVMSMYDPLGFLSHFTVKAKIIMQDVWRTGIGWDDEISDSIYEKWLSWIAELQDIPRLKIPRCYCMKMEMALDVQLHTFCDASEKAFAAISYLRVKTAEEIYVTIMMAKTRVSPLKPMSIPRLELQAALMASRLAETLITGHEIEINSRFFWSDSKTVISWLHSDARTYKPFVAVRVGEILETTDVCEWRWIPTLENVADEATRDCKLSDLSGESRWLNGPGFLKLPEIEWPKMEIEADSTVGEEDLEMKSEFVHATTEKKSFVPNYSKLNSWIKLVRSTAWMRRFVINFIAKCKNTQMQSTIELLPEELAAAEKIIWRQCQSDVYLNEISHLKSGKEISTSSNLYQLSPYLDEDGILRVKGRLSKAEELDNEIKFPVILNSKHEITKLIIQHYHRLARHYGQEFVCNEIRQRFWIPGLRSAVKKSWNDCMTCKIRRAKPEVPEMGLLPEIRMKKQPRPFMITGMDYLGPITVTVGRRHEKRWIVIFTCMSVRAIHLEVAASLSTDSAIMAIRRFIGRRGYPEKIYSDNGTNFHGADNELKKSLNDLDQLKIMSSLSAKGIEWVYSPPASPNFGGTWESLVKSVKVSLKNCLQERSPREELLHTLLVETELIVNSRPLTHVSIDVNDSEALTPNHFLLGTTSGVTFPGKFSKIDLCSRKQWRVAQELANCFWKRWVREYLPTLTKRTKWFKKTTPIKVGDIVIVADGNLERSHWPKGIIVKVHPGKDGQVRVADVKTSTGVYRRPTSKLCILDVLPKIVNEPQVLHEGKDGSDKNSA